MPTGTGTAGSVGIRTAGEMTLWYSGGVLVGNKTAVAAMINLKVGHVRTFYTIVHVYTSILNVNI